MAKVLMLEEEWRMDCFGKPGQIPEDWEVVWGLEMSDEERLSVA